ncbi:MAG: LPXTG cell wall anchor domain-containing protein [Streptosporangiaceae bacterium]|nr:LPXTG cell wall anchor domain-containing protein [Streptosporangiaceae bacterium]
MTPAVTVTVTTAPAVTAPPATGGGGTAGLQDGSLFALGGVAILAAAGSLGYRRKLTRKR